MAYSSTSCISVTALALATTWIVSALRFYVRRILLQALQWDDFFAMMAQAFYTVQCGWYLNGMIKHKLGQHQTTPDPHIMSLGIRDFFIAELTFVVATTLIKISFTFTLLRIVKRRLHVYTLYFVMAITLSISLVTFFYCLFTCKPVSYFYRYPIDPTGGHCRSIRNQVKESYAYGSVLLFTDIMLGIVLPLHVLSGIQLPTSIKRLAFLLLSLASVASIATIFRIAYSGQASNDDILYSINVPFFWAVLETGTAIFCTAAATLKPLLVSLKIARGSSHDKGGRSGFTLDDEHTASTLRKSSRNTKLGRGSTRGATRLDDQHWEDSSMEGIVMKNQYAPDIVKTVEFETVSQDKDMGSGDRKEAWDSAAGSWLHSK